jgi:hypothetical protein
LIVDLVAGRTEYLDAIVIVRVVAGTDHHACRESPSWAVKYAMAGVGTTPASKARADEAAKPANTACFNIPEESRVSIPTTIFAPGYNRPQCLTNR